MAKKNRGRKKSGGNINTVHSIMQQRNVFASSSTSKGAKETMTTPASKICNEETTKQGGLIVGGASAGVAANIHPDSSFSNNVADGTPDTSNEKAPEKGLAAGRASPGVAANIHPGSSFNNEVVDGETDFDNKKQNKKGLSPSGASAGVTANIHAGSRFSDLAGGLTPQPINTTCTGKESGSSGHGEIMSGKLSDPGRGEENMALRPETPPVSNYNSDPGFESFKKVSNRIRNKSPLSQTKSGEQYAKDLTEAADVVPDGGRQRSPSNMSNGSIGSSMEAAMLGSASIHSRGTPHSSPRNGGRSRSPSGSTVPSAFQEELPNGSDVSVPSEAESKLPEDDFIRYYVKSSSDETRSTIGFFDFLWHDLGCEPEEDKISSKYVSVEDDVFNFIRVPLEVESLLFYGFFMCLDSLLFVIVYLPLRMLRAVLLLVLTVFVPRLPERFRFHRTQLYDVLRIVMLSVAFVFLLQVHMSRIYHYVRGQAFIKLYVIFNMLDIFDRLMCSLGQDILDSLFYMTKTSPRSYIAIFFRLVLGVVYVSLHSLLYFVRLITLNAAINSTSNALMTILISNNFVELKGSVFKRFAEQNLFQITCSDMVERFELFVFLVLTGIESKDTWAEFFYGSAMYVFVCELLVDWIKHAFITKFNRIHFSCYGNFLEALCRDLAPIGNHKHPYATTTRLGGRPVDSTLAVANRIGLATLPLTCVIMRVLWFNRPEEFHDDLFQLDKLISVVLVVLCLVCLKSCINIFLKGHACKVLLSRERKILQRSSPRLSSVPCTPSEKELQKAVVAKHMQKIDQLAGIRRYQIFKSRIPT
uniref:Uncharacterized protein n=1 Tax=Mucochytrium quahogii TaxID=96639 RepID=A0A7S2RIS4_9STRA|mmetsp:Transcript_35627/g.56975  ORF Transcript_35627/g.56975 Transcript_35627/m.56975 type:complete len:813 (+) Transcript_35627:696-3134(+)